MLHVTTMPMPGALRLRALHPLIEGDGSCSLIYDLERAAVVEVPEELQFHVAPALETGDLDEALLGWLVNEDLLTGEGGIGWIDAVSCAPETAAWWNPGTLYRIDDTLHARIGQAREEAALEIVSFVFKQSFGNSRVKFHLSWGGSFPGTGLLERIVVESSRLSGMLNQEISYELTLDAEEVTPPRADFLAGYSFQVRLLCGSFPAPRQGFYSDPGQRELWAAEPAARLLVHSLGDRLTVCCTLDQGRLLDCWEWAKQTGVRHLDTIVLYDAWGRRRDLRNDLLAVCDEMADELAAQRLPVDYKPLTRIVDRLMRSEPLDQAYGERGSFGGLMPMADVYPRSVLDSFDLRLADLPGAPSRVEAGPDVDEPPCQGCWARHVCSHSTLLASAQPAQEEELQEISEERCSFWRTEVEVALRFYHRLAHTDPMQVRQFFDDSSREPAPAGLGLREDLGHLRMPF
ncbi:MAG TPA: hypothetical protein VHC97_19665 [Thermoanaerobaculia bacterium]|jgi:hypothetical protein|nr:hypothetical protein [Thermoanaerobaculia bacterium]